MLQAGFFPCSKMNCYFPYNMVGLGINHHANMKK